MTDETPDREHQADNEPEKGYEPPKADELAEDESAGTAHAGPANGSIPKSDRNVKRDFEPVDAESVLAGVLGLPIESWSYRADDPRVRHVGPMAQDFAAAFGVGDDDRHIHTVDASGVALAAIQALAARLAAAEARIEELQAERDPTAV
jgi:hypothetical protein